RNGVERRSVRLGGEDVEHRNCRTVELVHRREPNDLFDGAQDAGGIVLRAADGTAFGPGAHDISCRAIAANMIPAGLWVVFDGKYSHGFPKICMTQGLDNLPKREVVVGHL